MAQIRSPLSVSTNRFGETRAARPIRLARAETVGRSLVLLRDERVRDT